MSAGMGDVLTGVIAGLVAREVWPTPRRQVCLHSFAADRIVTRRDKYARDELCGTGCDPQ